MNLHSLIPSILKNEFQIIESVNQNVMVTHATTDHSREHRFWPKLLVVVVQTTTCVLQTLDRARQHPTGHQQVIQVSTFLYMHSTFVHFRVKGMLYSINEA